MSNSKHTPGPWSIYFNSQDDRVIRKMFPDGQESHSIARCHSGAANALLIAAAPEMLDALKAIVDCAGPGAGPEIGLALDAIQKATGDTP